MAPAMGMIGTLVGLVQMMANMDDPKALGPAMAVALLDRAMEGLRQFYSLRWRYQEGEAAFRKAAENYEALLVDDPGVKGQLGLDSGVEHLQAAEGDPPVH